jgi:ribonuclease Z
LTSLYEGDHVFGLLPLLASRLNGAGGTAEGIEDPRIQDIGDQEVSLYACRSFSETGLILGNSLSKYTGL